MQTRMRGTYVLSIAMLTLVLGVGTVWACGGFFCQQVPIDQAGEQIIFRQDGDMVTAVVLIQYEGEAEDFSWVVPAPGVPELSVGSDQVFPSLELATRPQFLLEINGSPCRDLSFPFPVLFLGGSAPPEPEAADDVTILA